MSDVKMTEGVRPARRCDRCMRITESYARVGGRRLCEKCMPPPEACPSVENAEDLGTRIVDVKVSYRLSVPATWVENRRLSVQRSLPPPPLRYVFDTPGVLPGVRHEYCHEPEFLSYSFEVAEDTR